MSKYTFTRFASAIALIVWAVLTWVAGYVVAPILFARYPSVVAGQIAGEVFRVTQQLCVACAMVMLIDFRVRFSRRLQQSTDFWAVIISLALILVQHLSFSPKMAALKMLMPDPQAASDFSKLHGASQVVYLIQSLLLAWMVWRRFRRVAI